jgi:hypothetical protein
MSRYIKSVVAVLLVTAGFSGCAGMTTTQRGALGGAAAGAGVGALVGDERGALIGAGVGAATGAIAGREVERRRYERRGHTYRRYY